MGKKKEMGAIGDQDGHLNIDMNIKCGYKHQCGYGHEHEYEHGIWTGGRMKSEYECERQ